jgi:hypothetical protein
MTFATLIFAFVFGFVCAQRQQDHNIVLPVYIGWRQSETALKQIVTVTMTASTATATPLTSVSGFEPPRPTDIPNSIYNSIILTVFLFGLIAAAYVIGVYSWSLFDTLRWRWNLGTKYERELRDSKVEVGESAGWSEVGSVERAVHYATKRVGLWWRPQEEKSAREGDAGTSAVQESGSVRERSGGIAV